MSAQDQIGVNPSGMQWSRMTTPAGDVIYPRGMDSTALQIAYRVNSAYLMDTAEVLYDQPGRRITTILQNQSVFPEGYATTIPWRQELYLAPPQNLFTGPTLWNALVTTHEYRHAQQFMAYNKGWTNLYKGLMGNTGWLFSTVLNVPLWYREGDAVDSETRFTTGGRGNLPAFHMEYRTLRLNDVRYSYEKAISASQFRDFVPNIYRSGYYMTRRLRQHHGDTALAYIADRSSSNFFYSFSRALEDFTGRRTPEHYAATFAALDSLWQASDTVTHVIGSRISRRNGYFEQYRFPQIDASGRLLFAYHSLKDIRGFYEMVQDGTIRKIRTAGVYSTDHEGLTVSGNMMAWAEGAYHTRYINKTYSVIKYMDLTTGKVRQLSHRSRYFSPAPSRNGRIMAVVKFSEREECSIEIIDIATGSVTASFRYDNWFLAQPRWMDDTQIVMIAVTDEGNQLVMLDVRSGQWDVLLHAYDVNVGRPFADGDAVYFSSGLSGIENIYRLDVPNRAITQLTNARFGAFDPFVVNDTLYFSNYDKEGYEIWQAPLSRTLGKKVVFPEAPVTNSMPGYYIDQVRDEVDASLTINTIYNAFFWNKLLAFTGWFPLVFPPEPGIELYTLNMERSLRSTIGVSYNLNEDVMQYRFAGSYAKLFPIINVSVLRQGRNLERAPAFYDPDSTLEMRSQETVFGGGIEIPLRLTQGVYNTGLTVKGDFQHYMFDLLEGDRRTLDFNAMAGELTFHRIRPAAHRQVQSPFAQSITARYTQGLGKGDPEQLFAEGRFYFPGVYKTHSFNVRASYEDNANSNTYHYLSTFRGSRGYPYYPFDEAYVVSVNYELPVWYPDAYLRGFAGVTRMRVNAFLDFSEGETPNFLQKQRSFGGELIFDLRLFRAFNMDLRLQFAHRTDAAGDQQPVTFNVGVGHFELLN